MYAQSENDPKDNIGLCAIGSSRTNLLAFAKYFPEEKDGIMALILGDATILPKLADRGSKSELFDICCAYPNYATEIAMQLFRDHATKVRELLDDFGLSENAFIALCLLMMSVGSSQFHYQDFIRIFPRQSEEIFSKLCENDEFFRKFMCHSSRFRITFAQLPQYQDRLVAALLRQPDDYWLEYFDQLAMLLLVIRSCEPRHHALFTRYFEIDGLYQEQVQFNDVEAFVEKLINLILVDSIRGINEFGVDMLKAIVRYYPQHQEAIFKALHDNPSVLLGFISNGPYTFPEMLREFPERMPLIIDTLSKVPAHPRLIGLFTHGIIEGNVAVADIALLNHYSLDKSGVIMDKLFSDQVLLKATLKVRRCYDYFKLASLSPNNKAKIIAVFAECYGDVLAALSGSLYAGVFPEEMWLWLDMARVPGFILNESQLGGLIARDYYLQDICQLFPEYKIDLIGFFLRNRKFSRSVFCNVDTLFYAAQQAPELQGELILLFTEFCSLTEEDIHNAEEGERDNTIHLYLNYKKANYNEAFNAFPNHSREILEIMFGNKVSFSRFQDGGIRAIYEFAHQYPEYQGVLINALKIYPNSFAPVLKEPEMLSAFFLLMPNRKALMKALDLTSNVRCIDYDKFSTALGSISELQIYLPAFLETLFTQREVLECIFTEWVLPKWLKLPHYQTQVLRTYCQYPEYLNRERLHFINLKEDLTEENSRLLGVALSMNESCKAKKFDSLDYFMDEELKPYVCPENKASIRVLIKLIDRMITQYGEQSIETTHLSAIRGLLVPQSFPSLQFFCVDAIKRNEETVANIQDLPKDLKCLF